MTPLDAAVMVAELDKREHFFYKETRMRKNGYDKTIEKAIIKTLDAAARKHGIKDVRHAANKWSTAQRDKATLANKQKDLQKQLAEVESRLKR